VPDARAWPARARPVRRARARAACGSSLSPSWRPGPVARCPVVWDDCPSKLFCAAWREDVCGAAVRCVREGSMGRLHGACAGRLGSLARAGIIDAVKMHSIDTLGDCCAHCCCCPVAAVVRGAPKTLDVAGLVSLHIAWRPCTPRCRTPSCFQLQSCSCGLCAMPVFLLYMYACVVQVGCCVP